MPSSLFLFSTRRLLLAATPALLLGLTPSVEAAPATKFLRTAEAVPGEYIVVMKGNASPQMASAQLAAFDAAVNSLAVKHNATVASRYNSALLGFAAKMTEADAVALSEDPSVAFVEENHVVRTSAVTQTGATWGLDRVDQLSLPLNNQFMQLGQGEGATIYVIDTGIRSTHTEFTGRVVAGFTAINDGQGTNDCNQHGTHVAGTAAGTTYGIAKKAKVVPVRVLNCEGSGTGAQVIAGIDYVAGKATPLSVANLSLGGPASDAEDAAIRGAVNAGTVMVVAAGNENADACGVSPAREPLAITVGATDIADARSSFSNYGTCVDLSAPGSNITSANITSDTATQPLSGTSMASPHVAGAVAAYRAANPSATPAQVAAAITGKAFAGKVTDVKGSPNRLLNTRFVDATAPTAAITAPANNASVAASFTVSATVTDANLVSVELSVDGAVVATKTAAPFDFQVSGLSAGSHTLTLTSKDIADQSSVATSTVTVTGAGNGNGNGNGSGNGSGSGTGGTGADDGAASEVTGGCSVTGVGGSPVLLLALFALLRRRRR
jgi:MYXO-CTERM domain-containing protein